MDAWVATAPRAYSARELLADRSIHWLGVTAGALGSLVLVSIAVGARGAGGLVPIAIYAAGLLAMLGFSAAYNLTPPSPRRAWLRRWDHAAIFVMIAGTYTPFTVDRLTGAWSILLTALVWALSLAGALVKFFNPRRLERGSVALYLALGWIGIVAARPLLAALDVPTLLLLGAGGLLYSIGTLFHLWRRLPFQNAVWHGFVLSAAACHYAAVLHGVVLAGLAL